MLLSPSTRNIAETVHEEEELAKLRGLVPLRFRVDLIPSYVERTYKSSTPIALTCERRGIVLATTSVSPEESSYRTVFRDGIVLDLLLFRKPGFKDAEFSSTASLPNTKPLQGFDPVMARLAVRENSSKGPVSDCLALDLAQFITGTKGSWEKKVELQLGSVVCLQIVSSLRTNENETCAANKENDSQHVLAVSAIHNSKFSNISEATMESDGCPDDSNHESSRSLNEKAKEGTVAAISSAVESHVSASSNAFSAISNGEKSDGNVSDRADDKKDVSVSNVNNIPTDADVPRANVESRTSSSCAIDADKGNPSRAEQSYSSACVDYTATDNDSTVIPGSSEPKKMDRSNIGAKHPTDMICNGKKPELVQNAEERPLNSTDQYAIETPKALGESEERFLVGTRSLPGSAKKVEEMPKQPDKPSRQEEHLLSDLDASMEDDQKDVDNSTTSIERKHQSQVRGQGRSLHFSNSSGASSQGAVRDGGQFVGDIRSNAVETSIPATHCGLPIEQVSSVWIQSAASIPDKRVADSLPANPTLDLTCPVGFKNGKLDSGFECHESANVRNGSPDGHVQKAVQVLELALGNENVCDAAEGDKTGHFALDTESYVADRKAKASVHFEKSQEAEPCKVDEDKDKYEEDERDYTDSESKESTEQSEAAQRTLSETADDVSDIDDDDMERMSSDGEPSQHPLTIDPTSFRNLSAKNNSFGDRMLQPDHPFAELVTSRMASDNFSAVTEEGIHEELPMVTAIESPFPLWTWSILGPEEIDHDEDDDMMEIGEGQMGPKRNIQRLQATANCSPTKEGPPAQIGEMSPLQRIFICPSEPREPLVIKLGKPKSNNQRTALEASQYFSEDIIHIDEPDLSDSEEYSDDSDEGLSDDEDEPIEDEADGNGESTEGSDTNVRNVGEELVGVDLGDPDQSEPIEPFANGDNQDSSEENMKSHHIGNVKYLDSAPASAEAHGSDDNRHIHANYEKPANRGRWGNLVGICMKLVSQVQQLGGSVSEDVLATIDKSSEWPESPSANYGDNSETSDTLCKLSRAELEQQLREADMARRSAESELAKVQKEMLSTASVRAENERLLNVILSLKSELDREPESPDIVKELSEAKFLLALQQSELESMKSSKKHASKSEKKRGFFGSKSSKKKSSSSNASASSALSPKSIVPKSMS